MDPDSSAFILLPLRLSLPANDLLSEVITPITSVCSSHSATVNRCPISYKAGDVLEPPYPQSRALQHREGLHS